MFRFCFSLGSTALLLTVITIITVRGDDGKETTGQPDDCASLCPDNVTVPDCGNLKMAPSYHQTCNCLIEYSCCPKKCQKPISDCARGTFPVDDVDCCNCPIIQCDECPKVDLPNCTRSECEDIELENTTLGCEIPVCRTRCPRLEDPNCSKCQNVQTYINATLCGCERQRCIPQTCSVPKKLDAADFPCHVIVNATDDCGCSLFKPKQEPYCTPLNEKARDNKCASDKLPDECFENVVNERTDACGCDTCECVLKEEKVVNQFKTRKCPKNHHVASGLTPCGRSRDACVKCPPVKVDETNCDSKCRTIQESKDFHGCVVKTCKKNPCKNCYSGLLYGNGLREDDCGCSVCRKLPEIVFQTRTSVDNALFHYNHNYYRYRGFKEVRGDFWLGLERIHKFTRAAYTGNYQLVLSARRQSDGKWMEIVYDSFYIDGGSNYYIRFGNVVEKHNTNITDSEAKYFKDYAFSAHDSSPYGSSYKNTASSYKGGWWLSSGSRFASHKICLNCDQRTTHLWTERGKTVKVSETQMSIRIKLP